MAEVKGLGVCMVPTSTGRPCGKQIHQGESIGTIINEHRTPIVGHKKCAEAYETRTMKLGKQGGPGGAIDDSSYSDALVGSIPLEKPAKSLEEVQMPPGVKSLADLPFDEDEAPKAEALPPRKRGGVSTEDEPYALRSGDRLSDVLQRGGLDFQGLTPAEHAQVDALRAKLLLSRKTEDKPIIHTIVLDMATVPRDTEVIRIELDLRNITD